MPISIVRSQPTFTWSTIPRMCLLLALAVGAGSPHCLAQDTVVLVGSGSTVPAPLFSKWNEEYNKRNPALQTRYLPVGTSEGIAQISRGVGDFAAGEAPLTPKQRADGGLIEMPEILIAIVPIYNLPGVEGELRLSGTVLADIFLGRIKTWRSASITQLNPQLWLPDLPIKVINRPVGRGSNYVFTEFLSKSSVRFKGRVGTSTSPEWPVGSAAERSSDMAETVIRVPGSIGFVEAQYAVKMNIPQAAVLNPAGNFVKASRKALLAACQAVEAPRFDRLSISLINAPGAESYPITSFSWLYLRTDLSETARARALAEWLNWMLSSGQQIVAQEGYASLPAPLLAKVKARVASLR
jgi:phosphate transport system substrate-binding protein